MKIEELIQLLHRTAAVHISCGRLSLARELTEAAVALEDKQVEQNATIKALIHELEARIRELEQARKPAPTATINFDGAQVRV